MKDDKNENPSNESNTESYDDSVIRAEVFNVVAHRASMCQNSVLAFQIQKAIPCAVPTLEKSSSLHSVLKKISEESSTDANAGEKKHKVVFQIPRKSIYATDAFADECVMYIGKEDRRLTKDFFRSLPVTIQDKRNYRKNIASALKKKPWYIECKELIKEKISNFLNSIDLWHDDLKCIEGQHGSAIVSYFVFIRWLLFMNLIIFFLNFCFMVFPYLVNEQDQKFVINSSVAANITAVGTSANFSSIDDLNKYCQALYAQLITRKTETGFFATFQNVLQGTGPLEMSELFLGIYPPYSISQHGVVYNFALASLCLIFIVFIICVALMIQFSSIGIEEAFLARNKRSNYYLNEVFSAWNYCLDSPKSASMEHDSFFLLMKTDLSEEHMKEEITHRSTRTWAKLYTIRIVVNIIIIAWLLFGYYLIYTVTLYQLKELQSLHLAEAGFRTLVVQFLSPITVMVVNSASPVLFAFLVQFENYHEQTVLNISIIRNVFVYLSSVMVLLNTFYHQLACEPKDQCGTGLGGKCHSPMCWETYIGQQLFKLTLTDMFVYIGKFLCVDTVRHYVTKNFDNKLTRLWGPPDFPLSTEVLAPVNSQTLLWLGLFYSPLLPTVMVLKLITLFYTKKTIILKYCERSLHSFRASRFNAVFMMILLVSFFTVLIAQTFAIERLPPSNGCSPYRQLDFFTQAIPKQIRSVLSLLMSHWTILISTVLLCIAMNYYWSVIISEKELTKHLKEQLVMQSCDKQYLLQQIADLTKAK